MAGSSAAADQKQAGRAPPPPDWTLDAALAWLNSKVNFERTPDRSEAARALKLERMTALANVLGNPQLTVPAIHVAGSKGKGSITKMAASMLTAAGRRAGAFTSPHLVAPNERVAVDREPIGDGDFARSLWNVSQAEARLPASVTERFGTPTYFEAITAAAFDHFADTGCGAAVYEVGLGGRLDSTNILRPTVCVLGSIELEHTEILGDTLEAIAAEKAGILKPGVAAISVPQPPNVLRVFRESASRVGAPLAVLGEDIEFSYEMERRHAVIHVKTGDRILTDVRCPFPGAHQAANTAAAIAACTVLLGDELRERMIREGLAQTPSDGRMEIVRTQPTTIVDGAHTPISVRAALDALPHDQSPLVTIFSCASDKDAAGMLAYIATRAGLTIFTEAGPRATSAAQLDSMYRELGGVSRVARDPRDALDAAREHADTKGTILACGSFMLAGAIKQVATDEV
ncbi:MAG: folylpolyglutamate synthase/dihydrofolate synthase family protein [Planctomycetota bacterium]